MYPGTLLLHSWLRWVVLLLGLVAVIRGIAGWKGRRDWSLSDELAGRFFIVSLDLQLLIGLLLYLGFSAYTRAAMQDFGAAMRDSTLRFWAVEHLFGMLVALTFAHVGRMRARKAAGARRHRAAAAFFGLALLAMLVSIPWPGTPNARPLFRW